MLVEDEYREKLLRIVKKEVRPMQQTVAHVKPPLAHIWVALTVLPEGRQKRFVEAVIIILKECHGVNT